MTLPAVPNVVTGNEWRAQASCLDMPAELWFPPLGAGTKKDAAKAKAVCADCPVRIECLDYAVTTCQSYGIWGGKGYHERRRIRRRREQLGTL